MPEPLPPRRPTSLWPIGAAFLGAFVVLAIVFRGSYIALQIMIILGIIVGLAANWNRSKQRPDPAAAVSDAHQPVPQPVDISVLSVPVGLPQVLTVKEAADYLRVNEGAVVGELEAGRLPGNLIGTQWRIRSEALVRWLDGAHGRSRPAQ